MNNKVYTAKIDEYDSDAILRSLTGAFDALGIRGEDFKGKKVAVKPNLIMKTAPETAATTHPAVINAILRLLDSYGVRPVIAESPGGLYTAARLTALYRACGMESAAEGLAELNTDTSSVAVSYPDGLALRAFNVIKPIADADIVIDAAKLKSHSLTKQTGAVKNLFGIIPGVEKFEMHARFPDEDVFTKAITDICSYLCENKRVIAVTDAVVCMEGNGPTGGKPRKVGYILVSENPAASDAVAGGIIGFDKVRMDETARERGMYPGRDGIELLGDKPEPVRGFVPPDSKKRGSVFLLTLLSGKKLGRYFTPRPAINAKKCVGCGECAKSCPEKTITIKKVGGRLRAVIDASACIRCFCCQELCPHRAVKTVRNPIVAVVDKIRR